MRENILISDEKQTIYFLLLMSLPRWMTSRVVVLQPDGLHFTQWEGCGQHEIINRSSLKHWLLWVCESVYVTLCF